MSESTIITIHPATAQRWPDFESLMGKRGGYGGCWCMLWRFQSADFEAGRGEHNRGAMKELFKSGAVPGLLAYDGLIPVGWCQVAPRRAFPRLDHSRVLRPVDEAAVWSVSCFLIRKSHRGRGVSQALLTSACSFAASRGGRVLEGYPIDPKRSPYPESYAWTGFHSVFRAVGFEEVARRSDTRPIMRKQLDPPARSSRPSGGRRS